MFFWGGGLQPSWFKKCFKKNLHCSVYVPHFFGKNFALLFLLFTLPTTRESEASGQPGQQIKTEQQKLATNSSCHTPVVVVVVVSAGSSGVLGFWVGVSLLIGGSKLPVAFSTSDERILPSCTTRFRVVGDVEVVHFCISFPTGSKNIRIYSMNILLCWPNWRSEIQRQGEIFKGFSFHSNTIRLFFFFANLNDRCFSKGCMFKSVQFRRMCWH